MAVRTTPDFKLITPNPNPKLITDAEWWLWERCKELEPKSKLGGIYANKSGFHNTAETNAQRWPGNYSIRHERNRRAPGNQKARAFDWTFPDAQAGNFVTIDRYTSRLLASALNPADPRLDLILFEFYGNADSDREVEGYNEAEERHVTSDDSHLWHLHESFWGDKCGDFWSMYALHTVHMGWSVLQWKNALPQTAPKPPPAKPPVPSVGIPFVKNGVRELSVKSPNMKGTDVQYVQKWIGPKRAGAADGIYGPGTATGVKWYQGMRGLRVDGIVGPATWRAMGVR